MEKAPGFESAKALVVQYLETYNDRARKIALLRYEIGQYNDNRCRNRNNIQNNTPVPI